MEMNNQKTNEIETEFERQEKHARELFEQFEIAIATVGRQVTATSGLFDSEIYNEDDPATRAFLQEAQQSVNDADTALHKANQQLYKAYKFKQDQIRRNEKAGRKKEERGGA